MKLICMTAAVIGASCAAGGASASVVTFDNSALSFRWSVNVPPFVTGPQLDPTLPAGSQSGAANAHTFAWYSGPIVTSNQIASDDFGVGGGTGRTVRGTQTFTFHNAAGDWGFTAMKTFAPGDTIGPAEDWQSYASMGAHGFALGNRWFLGTSAYAAIQFDLVDGTHFGWVHLGMDGSAYQPTAWAYETTPSTPITVVPAPGAAAAVVLGTAVARRRRR